MGIVEQLNEISNEICANYCKYQEQMNDIEDKELLKVLEEHCNDCPLNRI